MTGQRGWQLTKDHRCDLVYSALGTTCIVRLRAAIEQHTEAYISSVYQAVLLAQSCIHFQLSLDSMHRYRLILRLTYSGYGTTALCDFLVRQRRTEIPLLTYLLTYLLTCNLRTVLKNSTSNINIMQTCYAKWLSRLFVVDIVNFMLHSSYLYSESVIILFFSICHISACSCFVWCYHIMW